MGYNIPADHHGSTPDSIRKASGITIDEAPKGVSWPGRDITKIWVDELSIDKVKPMVIVESPYMGASPALLARNKAYARACVRDAILRGEAPFASHLLYTQPGILRDEIYEERELGMGLGWHVMRRATLVAIYTDLGWSSGMNRGKAAALTAGLPIVERVLGPAFDGWLDNYIATLETF